MTTVAIPNQSLTIAGVGISNLAFETEANGYGLKTLECNVKHHILAPMHLLYVDFTALIVKFVETVNDSRTEEYYLPQTLVSFFREMYQHGHEGKYAYALSNICWELKHGKTSPAKLIRHYSKHNLI